MKEAQGGWALVVLALAWPAGVALQLQQAALWAWPVYGLVAAAGLLVAWSVGRRLRRWPATVVLLGLALGVAALGWGSTGARAHARLAQRLLPELDGVDLVLVGRVADLPQIDATGQRFALRVEQAWRAEAPSQPLAQRPDMVWLAWGRSWHEDPLLVGGPAALRGGERWQLPVRLQRAHGVLNPHGFDAELWFFEQSIGAVGSVREGSAGGQAQRLAPARAWVPAEGLAALRQRLRDDVLLAVPDPRLGGVLAALTVGDQSAIDGSGWTLFQRTGVAHLMSISGLHITLFAWLAARLVGAGWRRQARWTLRWPAPDAARWGGLLLAAGYAALAGWGVPAQRTVGMLALAVLLKSLGVRWQPLWVCLWAGAGVSVLDPWALLQPGFWLSFMAVALLMASEPVKAATGPAVAEATHPAWQRRVWLAVKEAGRAQLVATLGLAPLAMVFFQQFSLVGLAANLVAVPVVTFVVTPLALAGLWWTPLLQLAALVLQPLWVFLQACGAWSLAAWAIPAAPWWVVGAALLGGACLVLPLPWRWRGLALPLLLPLIWPALPRPESGRFELLAADVGQGSGVLVRTASHLLVFDAGPQLAQDSDAGRRILLPLLQALGERRIDTLVLSHADLDHVGGAPALLSGLPVGQLRTGLPAGHTLLRGAVPHQPCEAGQRWIWDGVQFEVLHPLAASSTAAVRTNAMSCVLRVEDALGRRALLTGDIEAAQETELVQRVPERLRAEVLVVPHHGSKTSSSPAFLDAVAPEVAVIQVGHRSRFGHPHRSVLERYQAARIAVVRTDHCGAWRWDDAGAWCTRDVRRRYWQAPSPASGS